MERRPFGSTAREVAVIGQGTWNIEQADRGDSDRRAAPGPRSGHDPYRHRGDVWLGRGGGSGRRGDRRAARRGFPGLQGSAAQRVRKRNDRRLRAVLKRLRTDRLDCYLLHWRGRIRSRTRSPPSMSFAPTARSCHGASAISMSMISTRSPDRRRGPPACNQVLYHLRERAIEHAVIPWCEAERRRRGRLQPVRSRGGFPGPEHAGRAGAEGDRRPA